jgi:hypothetical protein
VGQDAGEEILGDGRPRGFVIAPGGLGGESGLVAQPVVTETIELSGADVEPLRGGPRVQLAGVEGGENFLDIEGWNSMSELGLFILGPIMSAGTAPGKGKGSFSL